MLKTLRIATRKSQLALQQAHWVANQIKTFSSNTHCTFVPITTEGDILSTHSLSHSSQQANKGLFIQALEQALLKNQADIAVHSIKDMTVNIPAGLTLAAVSKRKDPRDSLISNYHNNIATLPPQATVGTASLRRQYQLRALRSDLKVETLRGNVDTRLRKLDSGQLDAIILAAAGLIRLGLQQRIKDYLSLNTFLPAAGQGAIGIECRVDDMATRQLLERLNHIETAYCVTAERAVVLALGANCSVPVAAHATLTTSIATQKVSLLHLQGQVGTLDGTKVLNSTAQGNPAKANQIGQKVANDLLEQGAKPIIESYSHA